MDEFVVRFGEKKIAFDWTIYFVSTIQSFVYMHFEGLYILLSKILKSAFNCLKTLLEIVTEHHYFYKNLFPI